MVLGDCNPVHGQCFVDVGDCSGSEGRCPVAAEVHLRFFADHVHRATATVGRDDVAGEASVWCAAIEERGENRGVRFHAAHEGRRLLELPASLIGPSALHVCRFPGVEPETAIVVVVLFREKRSDDFGG